MRFSISVLIITFILSQIELIKVIDLLRVANRMILFLALLTFFTSTTINSFRWFLLTDERNLGITFPNIFKLHFKGFFFSMFLTGMAGGDIARAFLITKSPENRARAVSTIIVWRIIGVISLTIISLIS